MQTIFEDGKYYKPDTNKMAKTHAELTPLYQAHLRQITAMQDSFREYSNRFEICQNMLIRRNEAQKKWIHYTDKMQKMRAATDLKARAKVPRNENKL